LSLKLFQNKNDNNNIKAVDFHQRLFFMQDWFKIKYKSPHAID
jgi:hypothetical protein